MLMKLLKQQRRAIRLLRRKHFRLWLLYRIRITKLRAFHAWKLRVNTLRCVDNAVVLILNKNLRSKNKAVVEQWVDVK